jgi:hypothetical protein
MTSIPAAHGEASPVRLIPVASDSGILAYLPEPVYRALAPAGSATLTFSLPPLTEREAPAVGEGGRSPEEWSLPHPLDFWADVFECSRNTVGSQFRSGEIKARRRGRFWSVARFEIPRAQRETA